MTKSEFLRIRFRSGAMSIAAGCADLPGSRVWPFWEAALLCLSIRIRGYDDPNLHLPSATLTLHL